VVEIAGAPEEIRTPDTQIRSLVVPSASRRSRQSFKHGVLTVKMPKTAEAQKLVKKIEVKGG